MASYVRGSWTRCSAMLLLLDSFAANAEEDAVRLFDLLEGEEGAAARLLIDEEGNVAPESIRVTVEDELLAPEGNALVGELGEQATGVGLAVVALLGGQAAGGLG